MKVFFLLVILFVWTLKAFTQNNTQNTLDECLSNSAPIPTYLSDTCLYSDIKNFSISPGIKLHIPKYPLYTDSAQKTRWVYIPPGTKIDNSHQDSWNYPKGTVFWKQFEVDGKKIETRMLKKIKAEKGRSSWVFTTYKWNEEQNEAMVFEKGADNVMGTNHDIPNKNLCFFCHRGREELVLGFDQVQLAHTFRKTKKRKDIFSLKQLVEEQKFTHPSPTTYNIPGNLTEQNALGYMHGNCASCHNPQHPMGKRVGMFLGVNIFEEALLKQPVYQTAIHQPTVVYKKGMTRILPKNTKESALHQRVKSYTFGVRMPPFGRETVDPNGLKAITDWIQSLNP